LSSQTSTVQARLSETSADVAAPVMPMCSTHAATVRITEERNQREHAAYAIQLAIPSNSASTSRLFCLSTHGATSDVEAPLWLLTDAITEHCPELLRHR
jgi:hypothetical protein